MVSGRKLTEDANRPNCETCGMPMRIAKSYRISTSYECRQCKTKKLICLDKVENEQPLSPGQKAAITRALNRAAKDSNVTDYDNDKKNCVRERVTWIIKDRIPEPRTILALETREWLFVNKFDQINIFWVFEKDEREYKAMRSSKPDNVWLQLGDVEGFSWDGWKSTEIDAAWLDFCCTLSTALPSMEKLRERLKQIKVIAFTFCSRGHQGDYRDDIENEMLRLFPEHKICYRKPYKNTISMYTIVMENNK